MKIKKFLSAAMAVLFCCSAFTASTAAQNSALAAFPGAEGGGMYSLGARAAKNIEVYHVTNLSDSGAGSFRDAVSKGDRIVVFDVAGNIMLESILKITDIDNITILGQTAPGEGVCIGGESVLFADCDNVILRYLRIRSGDTAYSQEDALGVRRCTDFIVDHCSVTWSIDECLSAYENKNFTAQYCVISESLNRAHFMGAHGFGGIWGGINASFHHNLVSSHKSRLPRIGTSDTVSSYQNTPDYESLVDIRNNVFYNWRAETGYGGENGVRVNLINNYYKPTEIAKRIRFYESWAGSKGYGTTIHASGNIMEGNAVMTKNNWLGVTMMDGGTKCATISDGFTDSDGRLWPNDQYINDFPVTTQTAEEAYTTVLADVGASYYRDDIDQRIISNVINGTVPTGRESGVGLIDTQADVGGYVPLYGIKKPDTDKDGIPDDWENANGLDYTVFDSTKIASNGYTNIENYANDIIKTRYYNTDDTSAAAYLQAVIEKAEQLDITPYTAESLKNLDKAVLNAKGALENKDEQNYKTLARDIYSAVDALQYSTKKDLWDEIDRIKTMDLRHLTEASQNTVNAVLNAAENVYKNTAATDEEINAAIQSVCQTVTSGRYDRKNKGEAADVSNITKDGNTTVFELPYNAEHFMVSVDIKASGADITNYPLALEKNKIFNGVYAENLLHYISAFDDRGTLAIEVNRATGIIRYFINDMPVDEKRITSPNFTSAHLTESSGIVFYDNFTFAVLAAERIIPGDADADGALTANDAATVLQKALVSTFKMPIEAETDNYMYYMDADTDGIISASDSAVILQKVLVGTYTMPVELMTTTQTTTETATETTTETTTYYEYNAPNGTLFIDLENGIIVGCADDYTGGTLPADVNGVPVNHIGSDAFAGTAIEAVIIPQNYKTVASNAFKNCKNLKTAVFEDNPDMVIYNAAFANCTALTDVTLPQNLKRMQNTFKGRTALKKLVIPANTQLFAGTIAEPDCVLYISTPQAEAYAQQYGYEYVYNANG